MIQAGAFFRSPQNPPRLRDAYAKWLSGLNFTHFVTLAANDPMRSTEQMRKLLRDWDARVNRELVGPKWRKRRDERTNWIATLEKEGSNPHWHLLLQLLPEQIADLAASRGSAHAVDDLFAGPWRRLISSGTCDVRHPVDDGVVRYLTKAIDSGRNQELVTLSLEFNT